MKPYKKLLAAASAVALSLSLTGCVTPKPIASPAMGADYRVAIVKQLDHASLDEIAQAAVRRLEAIGAERGLDIACEIYSGQGDESVLNQIGAQIIADGVDAILPIATTAAQLMAVAAEETGTPVIYGAVSDPAAADLLGIDHVTGTSDALNTTLILDMMLAQNPAVRQVGLLYSLSEPNSAQPIAEARAYLEAKGIACEERTANTNDEVIAAAGALIAAGVDAVFTPTDNIIMAAELAIAPELAAAGIPHYAGADSFVRNGAFATCGVHYGELGAQTADLAFRVLTGGMDDIEDYYLVEGGIITVNTETAATLGADYSAFASMGTVVEVTTTEE